MTDTDTNSDNAEEGKDLEAQTDATTPDDDETPDPAPAEDTSNLGTPSDLSTDAVHHNSVADSVKAFLHKVAERLRHDDPDVRERTIASLESDDALNSTLKNTPAAIDGTGTQPTEVRAVATEPRPLDTPPSVHAADQERAKAAL